MKLFPMSTREMVQRNRGSVIRAVFKHQQWIGMIKDRNTDGTGVRYSH